MSDSAVSPRRTKYPQTFLHSFPLIITIPTSIDAVFQLDVHWRSPNLLLRHFIFCHSDKITNSTWFFSVLICIFFQLLYKYVALSTFLFLNYWLSSPTSFTFWISSFLPPHPALFAVLPLSNWSLLSFEHPCLGLIILLWSNSAQPMWIVKIKYSLTFIVLLTFYFPCCITRFNIQYFHNCVVSMHSWKIFYYPFCKNYNGSSLDAMDLKTSIHLKIDFKAFRK